MGVLFIMKKNFCRCLSVAMLSLMIAGLTSCGNSSGEANKSNLVYQDGDYEAESSLKDEHGGYGKIKIHVSGGKISDVSFEVYKSDGSIKDKTYATDQNEGLYKIAQNSLLAIDELEGALVKTQDVSKVDTVSGATWNSDLFRDAARKALSEASGVDLTINEDNESLSLVEDELNGDK